MNFSFDLLRPLLDEILKLDLGGGLDKKSLRIDEMRLRSSMAKKHTLKVPRSHILFHTYIQIYTLYQLHIYIYIYILYLIYIYTHYIIYILHIYIYFIYIIYTLNYVIYEYKYIITHIYYHIYIYILYHMYIINIRYI